MLRPLPLLLAASSVLATANTHWFGFGDSYTKVRFNYTLDQPNDANPFELPGNTACGWNPNWMYWNVMKYNTTHVYAYDFAFGGATIDRNVVTPSAPEDLTVVEQVDQFEVGYTGEAPVNQIPWTSANSLFSTFIGINDIGRSYQLETDQSALHDALMDSYISEMQRLYDYGARNFVFLNVPPTDRSPMILKRGAEDSAKCKAAIADYNTKLEERVTAFRAAHSDVSTWIVDSSEVIGKLLDDPTKYGFRDATSYGSAPDLIWCNDYHISPAAHDYLAQAVQVVMNGTGLI